MSAHLIFWPIIAMVALSFLVWLRMYFERVGQMRRERINPQSVATSAQAAARLSDTRAADNFRNLFEVPVLFYLAVVVAFLTAQVSTMILVLAWAFVILRYLHSAIHCSYNRVMHRFAVYVGSTTILWIFWIILAIGLKSPIA